MGNDWFYSINYIRSEIRTRNYGLVIHSPYFRQTEALLGLSVADLEQLAQREGQKAFRGRQIYDWVYNKGAKNIDEISVLPKAWRDSLMQKGIEIGRLHEVKRLISADETTKLLLKTNDNELVETVAIPTANRLTVCVSSQIGCPMACRFCATGKGGLKRSLEVNEIVDQVLSANEATGRRPTNVVFMGMGEPLLNLEKVLNSIRCLNIDLGIGQRRITVSTVGVPNEIPNLAKRAIKDLKKAQFTLAVSLHAPNQDLREQLIPSAKLYPINKLLDDCKQYLSLTGRRVSFEYILLGKLNDHLEHAEELSSLLKGFQSHVNLIAYNPIDEEDFQRPTNRSIEAFKTYLQRRGIAVSFRTSRGLDQNAACGQLRRKHETVPNHE
tara:strand:- start:1124 stop:2272 length:1149 start_codon:yes stop_codon:yes gene_type:complete